jgi:1-acyl-sn-glycerol-3-phosphate acyltransferase
VIAGNYDCGFLAHSVFQGVLIERKKVTRSNNPMDQLLPILLAGESLILFPEGGRTTGPAMGPLKSGLTTSERPPAVDLVPVRVQKQSA